MDKKNHEHNHMEHEHHEQQHQHDHNHDHHDHHAHMMEDFKKRFYVSLILTIPILLLSPMIQDFMNVDWRFTGDMYVLFALSTVVFFYGGYPFLTGMIDEVKQKNPGMMNLIAMAIIVAYGYSALTVFGLSGRNFFWELATLIDVMLIGHWIEMKSVMQASSSLEKLMKLMPNTANRLKANGETEEVSISDLQKGDQLLIKPGEKIPADGNILKGKSDIDESMLTGESTPVTRSEEDEVIGGSINGQGSLTVSVEKIGQDSYLSQVVKLVQDAQNAKSKTQDLSDRMAKWLFYVAVGAGLVTFLIWIFVAQSFDYALERAVTVMVIACPHALGLAAPLVVAKSTSLAATNGLLIRKRASFEEARKLDTVIFDKTGTLTKGEFGVVQVETFANWNEQQIISYAAALEVQSEHPIAQGIVNYAQNQEISTKQPTDFESITGKGIQGNVDNKYIQVVSRNYLDSNNLDYQHSINQEGATVVYVVIDKQVAGAIALADQVKPSAKEAIQSLKQIGIASSMLTGDNQKVANWVGNQLNLDHITAEVLPDQKASYVKEYKNRGKKVAMTGDGINDAPALASADLGIAIGAGTDVAMETADVILVESDPNDVVHIIRLSRATYKKMMQNLWWAAGYNIIAIPLAAGILAPIGIILSPAVGAILMSLSTVIVAINARLFKYNK